MAATNMIPVELTKSSLPLAASRPSSSYHRRSLLPARPCVASRTAGDRGGNLTVLVAEEFGQAGLELLRRHVDIVDYSIDLDPGELGQRAALCEALIVSSETKVGEEVFQLSRGRLKVVGIAGFGVDNVDLVAANESRCLVVNAPNASTAAVAEHAIALLTAMARNIARATISVKFGNWQRRKYMGKCLSGKTLAVMGFGEVGSEVARRAKGLGMHVIAYDPYASEYLALAIGVELVSFDKAIAIADFISLHMHLTPATRKMLNDETFAKMKRGVQILNVAHEGLIDEDSLVRALDAGVVSQAALDVLLEEPLARSSKLIHHENVIVTPNLGASTFEAQEEVGIEIAEAVIKALKGNLPATVVNEPLVALEVLAELKPFLDLENKLGRFIVKLIAGRGGLKTVKVTYASAREPDQLDTKLLRTRIIKGLIEPISCVIVNWVNGDSVAKQRGLRITEERMALHGSPEYPLEYIQVQIANAESTFASALAKSGEIEVEGRVRDGVSYLTKIGSLEVNVQLEGSILLCIVVDQPGLIGKIGSILGEANVNISSMKADKMALRTRLMMISITVDQQPNEETLKKVRDVPAVQELVFLML
ncbi:D-3-phosphoglycerate dehydrogenase 3, chloroplastic [Eucalyptus grandis]|uniref:D-3-phosphoglycerate dehydrogenase 3, chloroplastic n=1 Tax=Eucalyptus grandis TaxID=71139 RepID=UPI00192EFEA7|nr:D-3-phosphoglycerate dehydrogenase 3, chloroplastic [Eucalyptus grandis]